MLRIGTQAAGSVQSQKDQQRHLQEYEECSSSILLRKNFENKAELGIPKRIRNVNDSLWSVCLFEISKLVYSKSERFCPPGISPNSIHDSRDRQTVMSIYFHIFFVRWCTDPDKFWDQTEWDFKDLGQKNHRIIDVSDPHKHHLSQTVKGQWKSLRPHKRSSTG